VKGLLDSGQAEQAAEYAVGGTIIVCEIRASHCGEATLVRRGDSG